MPVRTPFDGFVDRVHVSDRGYGFGLFLTAPDGTRTTYGHLNDFDCDQPDLELLRRAMRLLTFRRGVMVGIPPRWFRFKAGDCIARSGESGSGAPHLHFEVFQNGRFIDPLSLQGLHVGDREAPHLLNLYVDRAGGEILRFPVRRVVEDPETKPQELSDRDLVRGGTAVDASLSRGDRPPPETVRYEIDSNAEDLPELRAGDRVRLLIGAYDRMAARNRNGVRRLKLVVDGREIYRQDIDALSRGDLVRSSTVYHTARTVIGNEYVYLLYRGSGRFTAGQPIEVTVSDASGNQAVLDVRLPLSGESGPSRESRREEKRLRPEVPFQTVPAGRTTKLQAGDADARMEVRFDARSLHETGEARFFRLNAAPENTRGQFTRPEEGVSGAGKRAGIYSPTGPVFVLEGRDLFYRSGAWATAEFPDVPEVDGRVALYVYNYTLERWLLVAFPYRRRATTDDRPGRLYYRFNMRYEGPLAQLRDHSPPRLLDKPLWDDPTITNERGTEFVREYMIADAGSGFSRADSQVLVDGRPVPFEYVRDRAVIRVALPKSLVPQHGVVISVRVGDHGGNTAPWFFDFLEPPAATD